MTHFFPSRHEAQSASHSYEVLSHMLRQSQGIRIGEGKNALTLPETVTELLMEVLSQISEGKSVGLTTLSEEMTTQEAADFLNVSRPHLVSLLKKVDIPYRKVGNRMRLRSKDVLSYKETLFSAQVRAVEQLSEEAQKLGLGYE